MLDFSLFKLKYTQPNRTPIRQEHYNTYEYAFNQDDTVKREILRLRNNSKISLVVETGTAYGHSAYWFADHFPQVLTIENDPKFHAISSEALSGKTNTTSLYGSSKDVLADILPLIKEKLSKDECVLFYLDAHAACQTPLRAELALIQKYIPNKSLIIIDDFQVPGKDFSFDTYESKYPNNVDYIQDSIDLNNYIVYYNNQSDRIKKCGYAVGKVHLVPNSLAALFEGFYEASPPSGVLLSTVK
jgi:predicted O-methyltransferase YrrM